VDLKSRITDCPRCKQTLACLVQVCAQIGDGCRKPKQAECPAHSFMNYKVDGNDDQSPLRGLTRN